MVRYGVSFFKKRGPGGHPAGASMHRQVDADPNYDFEEIKGNRIGAMALFAAGGNMAVKALPSYTTAQRCIVVPKRKISL